MVLLTQNIRHRFGLTGSCLVQTKSFYVLFGFSWLYSPVITEKLSGDKTLVNPCKKNDQHVTTRAPNMNKYARGCSQQCHTTVKVHDIDLPQEVRPGAHFLPASASQQSGEVGPEGVTPETLFHIPRKRKSSHKIDK